MYFDLSLSSSVVFRSAKERAFAERKPTLSPRIGFTLIELLVVIGVMGVLAAIMLFAYSPFQTRSAANYGGVQLQSWLNAAKQRAIRDRRPCGLRLLIGEPATPNLVTGCIYIEQAEDLVGTGVTTVTPNPATNPITQLNVPGVTESSELVSIEVNGGLVHQGKLVGGSGTTPGVITLKNAFPYKIPDNSNATFRIIRSPRAIADPNKALSNDINNAANEDVLRIPVGAVINLDANAFVGAGNLLDPATAPLDIMFNPDGSVQTPAVNDDRIILWVTNTQQDATGAVDPRQGQPSLIVVNTKTGAIAGYPAVLDWNPTTKTFNNASVYNNVP